MIEVFKPGSWVLIGDTIPATVKQVCIAGDGITYDVVWWSDRERKSAWLAAYEVQSHELSVMQTFGFKPAAPA